MSPCSAGMAISRVATGTGGLYPMMPGSRSYRARASATVPAKTSEPERFLRARASCASRSSCCPSIRTGGPAINRRTGLGNRKMPRTTAARARIPNGVDMACAPFAMSVLVRDESHYVAEKPGLEADGQPIARALVLEVDGHDQPMRRAVQTVKQTGQRCTGEVIANEGPAGSQHTCHFGDRAFPVDDVMQHQAADDGVERIAGERQRGRVRRFRRSVGEFTQARGGRVHHERVDIYCRPTKFGIAGEQLLGHRSTAGTDFQNVAA